MICYCLCPYIPRLPLYVFLIACDCYAKFCSWWHPYNSTEITHVWTEGSYLCKRCSESEGLPSVRKVGIWPIVSIIIVLSPKNRYMPAYIYRIWGQKRKLSAEMPWEYFMSEMENVVSSVHVCDQLGSSESLIPLRYLWLPWAVILPWGLTEFWGRVNSLGHCLWSACDSEMPAWPLSGLD